MSELQLSTRRDFIGGAGLLALTAATCASGTVGPEIAKVSADRWDPPDLESPADLHAQVVSFHADRPYLDVTGRGVPYIAPQGLRSADVLSGLDETALRQAHPYL
jgi:hypothetical protein